LLFGFFRPSSSVCHLFPHDLFLLCGKGGKSSAKAAHISLEREDSTGSAGMKALLN
jgi:hypothetical protein